MGINTINQIELIFKIFCFPFFTAIFVFILKEYSQLWNQNDKFLN